MKTTNLGRTGLIVSQLCLGTMNFGQQYVTVRDVTNARPLSLSALGGRRASFGLEKIRIGEIDNALLYRRGRPSFRVKIIAAIAVSTMWSLHYLSSLGPQHPAFRHHDSTLIMRRHPDLISKTIWRRSMYAALVPSDDCMLIPQQHTWSTSGSFLMRSLGAVSMMNI